MHCVLCNVAEASSTAASSLLNDSRIDGVLLGVVFVSVCSCVVIDFGSCWLVVDVAVVGGVSLWCDVVVDVSLLSSVGLDFED